MRGPQRQQSLPVVRGGASIGLAGVASTGLGRTRVPLTGRPSRHRTRRAEYYRTITHHAYRALLPALSLNTSLSLGGHLHLGPAIFLLRPEDLTGAEIGISPLTPLEHAFALVWQADHLFVDVIHQRHQTGRFLIERGGLAGTNIGRYCLGPVERSFIYHYFGAPTTSSPHPSLSAAWRRWASALHSWTGSLHTDKRRHHLPAYSRLGSALSGQTMGTQIRSRYAPSAYAGALCC